MCKKCADVDEMIGQKFNKLIVLERVENGKKGEIRYLCKCECGNETIVRKYSLTHNHTKSCGRCREPKPGDKFGHLTVIKKTSEKDRSWNVYYECMCDCGNMTKVTAGNLRHELTKSCGRCKELKLGDKFGCLTVIKKSSKKDRFRNDYYKCRCICGNMIEVSSINLRHGRVKSCGCIGSSSGEYEIYNFLDANFIHYIREKPIEELVTSKGGHPRFDFELFDKYGNSFFLEFHGEQHYWSMRKTGFGERQREETDPMKIKYCEDNDESLHVINCFEDVDSSLIQILYYREMLTPKRLVRNKIVYKLKQTLFMDKNGHLSIFSTKEDNRAAA